MDVPLFYIVKRGLSSEQMESVMRSLSITPCMAVFASSPKDAESAITFGETVSVAPDADTALGWAKEYACEYGRPTIVFGEAELLDAVYADGRREPVPANA